MSAKVPGYIAKAWGGARAYRAAKRREIFAVCRAIAALRGGCVGTPVMRKIIKLGVDADAIRRKLSRKEWGP